MLLFAAILIAASVAFVIIGAIGALREVPKEDRTYQDPLPALLQMIWPLVSAATYVIAPILKSSYLEKAQRSLQAAGQDYLISPEELAGLRVVTGGLSAAFFVVCGLLFEHDLVLLVVWAVVGLLLGLLYPTLWLADRRKKRVKRVIKDLPIFLDFMTMTIEAGLNVTGAIERAVEKCPPGPLSQEFARMIRDQRAGLPRSESMTRLSDRMDIPQVSNFTSAVIQAERVGASLGDVLRAQAMQRREERFLHAEKLANEAPVKMMGPLILFFFPLIFIILLYFIYLRLVEQGTISGI